MKTHVYLFLIFLMTLTTSCEKKNPNLNKDGQDKLETFEVDRNLDKSNQVFFDVVYVPIYSDIYADQQNLTVLLAATLSIRNTSHEASLYISKVEYYNTGGELVRSYLERPISLPPMATINYVIDKDDDEVWFRRFHAAGCEKQGCQSCQDARCQGVCE